MLCTCQTTSFSLNSYPRVVLYPLIDTETNFETPQRTFHKLHGGASGCVDASGAPCPLKLSWPGRISHPSAYCVVNAPHIPPHITPNGQLLPGPQPRQAGTARAPYVEWSIRRNYICVSFPIRPPLSSPRPLTSSHTATPPPSHPPRAELRASPS